MQSLGFDPAALRRIYNVVGAIGAVRGGPGLTGDVHSWVDALTDWSVELSFDTFVFWWPSWRYSPSRSFRVCGSA